MELRQLVYFVRIAEARSFSRAAASLHVAQPALSRQISLLEKELGVELLVRNGRGAVPTGAGEQLLTAAKDILQRIEEVRWQISELSTKPSGTIRIGLPLSVSRILTPELFDRAAASFPNVTLHVSEAWTGHICRNLLDRELDFGVINHQHLTPKMVHRELSIEDVHLISAPARAPRCESIAFGTFAEMPLVLPPRPHGMRLIVDHVFQQHGIRPQVVLESEVWSIIIDVVQKGIAHTVFPPWEFKGEIRSGALRSTPIVDPSMRSGLCLARLSDNAKHAHLQRIFDFIGDELQSLIGAARCP